MSIVKMLVSVRIYWENSTHFSDIADIMSRNKFEKLLHYFHSQVILESS